MAHQKGRACGDPGRPAVQVPGRVQQHGSGRIGGRCGQAAGLKPDRAAVSLTVSVPSIVQPAPLARIWPTV
jgi:hypothetical protein